jgi:hypothetical protein
VVNPTNHEELRVPLLVVGLVLVACTAGLSIFAARRGAPWTSVSRFSGAMGTLAGWSAFSSSSPTWHDFLYSPLLLLVAVSYPLLAVERGRGIAWRVFSWTALVPAVLGCACGVVLAKTQRNAIIQEALLQTGRLGPPVVLGLVVTGRLLFRGLRAARRPSSQVAG